MPNWNLELVSILKEFVFNAGFFVILLALCCLFLWIGLFYRFIKFAFTITIALFVFSCFQATPNFLLDHLLSDQDRQTQSSFLDQKDHPLIASHLPKCVQNTNGIIVLGGGVTQAGYLSYSSMERILGLIELLKKMHSQKILIKEKIPLLFSGGVTEKGSQESEAQVMKKYAFYFDKEELKDFPILLDSESLNTYQNAVYAKQIFQKKSYSNNIILLTSDFHMKRAQKTFEKKGFHVCPVSAASSIVTGNGIFNFHNAIATTALLNEYFGLLGYKIREWI